MLKWSLEDTAVVVPEAAGGHRQPPGSVQGKLTRHARASDNCVYICIYIDTEECMRAVGVRELKQRTSEVLRELRARGEEIDVTHHGRVIARLVPVRRTPVRRRTTAVWSTMDQLAREIGARWLKRQSAAAAVREGRREL